MTKRTSQIEKKTFIGLVINKLADNGFKELTSRITAKSGKLDVQYKTAQRYARDYIYTIPGGQEKLLKELEALMKKQVITESEAEAPALTNAQKKAYIGSVIEKFREKGGFTSTIKKIENKENDLDLQYKTTQDFANRWLNDLKQETEASPVSMVEAPVTPPVDDIQPVETFWATPDAVPYLKLADWLHAIDNNMINGTIKEAREFISTIDGYADKLQALVVKRAKEQLKNLLREVKGCEAVLDKAEVENVWLEVATEKGELTVAPFSFSADTATHVVEMPITDAPEVEQSNTVAL